MYIFRKIINDVGLGKSIEKSKNVKDFQNSTIRCLLYISKFVLGKFSNNFD